MSLKVDHKWIVSFNGKIIASFHGKEAATDFFNRGNGDSLSELNSKFDRGASGSSSGRWTSPLPRYENIPKPKAAWHCADGRVMSVTEMTDDHLRNARNLLRRRGFVHTSDALSCLQYASSVFAGEYAAMAAEEEFDKMKFNRRADAVFDECELRNIR